MTRMGSRSLNLTISGSDDLTIWGLMVSLCREVSRRDNLRHGVKQRYIMRTVVPVQTPLRIDVQRSSVHIWSIGCQSISMSRFWP